MLQRNLKQIGNMRTLTLIFGGMTAGIFGLDGLQGIAFYLLLISMVSLLIVVMLGFKAWPYFTSLSQAATNGMFSNLLT